MNMQNVFQQSPVNGGAYNEVEPCAWSWPKGTWLQHRRAELGLTKREGVIKLTKHMEGEGNGLERRGTLER